MSDARVTRPYPEARGPHLPDALTRVPPLAYVFAVIALLLGWQAWQSATTSPLSPLSDAMVLFARGLVPSAVIPLIGVVLLLRQPDARRTLRLLLFGIGLLTAHELIVAFSAPLRELLRQGADFSELETPGELALRVFSGLLMVFGLLYVGAGLSATRGPHRHAAERLIAAWLATLAAIGVVLSLYAMTTLRLDDYPAGVLVSVVVASVLEALITFAWVYLASVVIGGWLAGDRPRRAWIIAGIGGGSILAVRLIGVVASMVVDEVTFPIFFVLAYADIIGWLVLIVGFVLGLPADRSSPTADPPAMTPPGSVAG